MKINEYEPKNAKIRPVTLGFLVDESKVLLAEKKVRFGKGKVTGIGGKLEDGESLENALIRESIEEISVKPLKLSKIAVLNFLFPHKGDFVEEGSGRTYSWDQQVHAYLIKEWEGGPKESEEIKPVWFDIEKVPYDRMWADAHFWTPLALKGEKLTADFLFDKEYKVEDFRIQKGL